jgi:lipid-binding SYLF domain-containing protein
MDYISRRSVFLGMSSLGLLAACDGGGFQGNGVNSRGAQAIDARVNKTQEFLFSRYPGTQSLASQAQGVLYMPLITEAGFMLGGAYGRGALKINNQTVDYYSATKATYGFQIGGQQYANVIFFMTPAALQNFRASPGWVATAEARYATPIDGAAIGKETTEIDPVIIYVFGQQGLAAGATLGGVKYSRIIP